MLQPIEMLMSEQYREQLTRASHVGKIRQTTRGDWATSGQEFLQACWMCDVLFTHVGSPVSEPVD